MAASSETRLMVDLSKRIKELEAELADERSKRSRLISTKDKPSNISQATLDRLVDVFIEFVRENMKLNAAEPFVWFWYDDTKEAYEFALREEDAPPDADPLYRKQL